MCTVEHEQEAEAEWRLAAAVWAAEAAAAWAAAFLARLMNTVAGRCCVILVDSREQSFYARNAPFNMTPLFLSVINIY